MAGPTPAQPGADTQLPNGMVPDPDNADWAALARELEQPDDLVDSEGEGQPQRREPPRRQEREEAREQLEEPEGESEEGEGEAEPRAKPTYEQLQSHYSNNRKALQQARESERSAREQLSNITKVIEGLRERRAQQQQVVEEPKEPPAPDVNEDPIGYFKHELAKRDAVIEQMQQRTTQSVQQVRQHQQTTHFIQEVERSEHEMRARTPDYDAACEHLEKGRISELAIMLPDNSPQAAELARRAGLQSPAQLRNAMLNNDRIAVARHAFQTGRSPAEVYYTLAKSRGYVTRAQPNGRTRQASSALEAAENVIDTARRGQRAARSVGGGSGEADNLLNVDDLADLMEEDPEAFDKEWERLRRAGKLG